MALYDEVAEILDGDRLPALVPIVHDGEPCVYLFTASVTAEDSGTVPDGIRAYVALYMCKAAYEEFEEHYA